MKLLDEMIDYAKKCKKTKKLDRDENIESFMRENSHITGLTRDMVEQAYDDEMKYIHRLAKDKARYAKKRWSGTTQEERSAEMSRIASMPRKKSK